MLPLSPVFSTVVSFSVEATSPGDKVYIDPLSGSITNQPIKPPNTRLPAMYQPLALALTGIVEVP